MYSPGRIDSRHGSRRRPARQALRHSRHHRHRQVLHDGADPSFDTAEASCRAHRSARSAQRICDGLPRVGRGDQSAQHAPAVLASDVRGDRRGPRGGREPQGRDRDPAGTDPACEIALQQRSQYAVGGRPPRRRRSRIATRSIRLSPIASPISPRSSTSAWASSRTSATFPPTAI